VITLDRLVNVLGGYGVVSQLGSVPRSTELRSVVIPEPGVFGDVVLAIAARSVDEALGWAVAAGAKAVLVRGPDVPAGAQQTEHRSAGVAVLHIHPSVPWSELAAVVYGLVLEGRETESGRGPTDLFALADSLADGIGCPVLIEDRRARVLAYSRMQTDADPARVQSILNRATPEPLRAALERRGVVAQLSVSDEPFFVDPVAEHGLTGRMVVAARVGRELLGSVWVSCSTALDGPARTALADGARTVALHLLRSRASADLERQVESESVIRLLEGTAEAATVVSRLGLPQERLRVIAVRPRIAAEPHTALLVAFEQATAGFGWSRPGRSAVVDNAVYTVLPAESATQARLWTTRLATALPPNAMFAAGISGEAAAVELATARREADECLALHEADAARADPPAYDESWDDILLQRLRTAAGSGRSPTRGPVAELIRYDDEHGTPFVATLRAWLEAQGDAAQTADRLGVHENTVRNRLRRMLEIAPLNLDDPDKRLAMVIQLATVAPQPTVAPPPQPTVAPPQSPTD
jgi:hypothetical protein